MNVSSHVGRAAVQRKRRENSGAVVCVAAPGRDKGNMHRDRLGRRSRHGGSVRVMLRETETDGGRDVQSQSQSQRQRQTDTTHTDTRTPANTHTGRHTHRH